MLKGKTVVLGVTGGIAAYKSCEIVSRLRKLNADVRVLMTAHATEFVTPLTFETLSGNRVVSDMFSRDFEWEVEHVSLAKAADVFVVAPATANVIGKLNEGIADDMLTTTFLACKAPKIICPAMNTNMLENEQVASNLAALAEKGCIVVDSVSGRLACGDEGKGKMAEPVDIVEAIKDVLMPNPDYLGKCVLVTAGATEEDIDGVRYITNRSSGKMGIAIASAAAARGAEVVLVAGKINVDIPKTVSKVIRVTTTDEMLNAVLDEVPASDVIIKAAAPADYKVLNASAHKLKASAVTLELVKNPDIAKAVGAVKGDRKLVVFSAETDDLIANATAKLFSKNADMVVANDVTKEGAGFNSDTNIVSIITAAGDRFDSGLLPKSEVADLILDTVLKL